MRRRHGASKGAFSLIEIMVAVGLMTIIVLGLLAMFDQTTRAFKVGMGQTDVLESGRATLHFVNLNHLRTMAFRKLSMKDIWRCKTCVPQRQLF